MLRYLVLKLVCPRLRALLDDYESLAEAQGGAMVAILPEHVIVDILCMLKMGGELKAFQAVFGAGRGLRLFADINE